MRKIFKKIFKKKDFSNSSSYWENRYASGKSSGKGSYGRLSEFKANVINNFVSEKDIDSVIEYGCGDGNQLSLANYKNYIGFDVSSTAIDTCKNIFKGDITKKFFHISEYRGQKADLTLSLDVIYHLVEDDVFDEYMKRLFDSSNRFVIIYSNNESETPYGTKPHVRWRKFTDWVDKNETSWDLIDFIKNSYPDQSFADFFIYEKKS